jgi:hypothetical protein
MPSLHVDLEGAFIACCVDLTPSMAFRRAAVMLLALTTIILGSWTAAGAAAAAGPVEGHWTGVALTTTGHAPLSLTLRQDGPRITGVYQGGATPRDVEGMLAGKALMLRILNSRGYLHLMLSDDGRTITGDGTDVAGAHLSSIRLTKM